MWTHFVHDTLLLCRGMRKRFLFVVIWLARAKILDGPKHDFLPRNGTNGHEQPRAVPSCSTRSSRIKTRPHASGVWVVPEHGGGALDVFKSPVCIYHHGPLSASHYFSFISKRSGRRMPPVEQSALYIYLSLIHI